MRRAGAGAYANIRKHPSSLILRCTTDTGEVFGPVVIPMRKQDLLERARSGDFFSYSAGVAYKILTDYQVSGLVIDNFKTDLPTRKGLSSSAAICVLTARAFNQLYDLKMTIRGEMEYAYQGEILTPSQCGRMDQGCAYGNRPILMKYDGEFMDVVELSVSPSVALHYVLVDFQGEKSTTLILQGLQAGYPTPETDIEKGVHELLGPLNKRICDQACGMLARGDGPGLGKLMTEAQDHFDRLAQPACPSELTMPLLHKVMHHPPLKPHIWGMKGVGSQGDGTGQLLCKSAADQAEVQRILRDELKMPSITLTLSSGPEVKVALIPAAGFGAANFPATLPIRSELFPLVFGGEVAKPIIFHNVEALVEAGIERVCIIVQEEDRHSFERLFKIPVPKADFARLSREQQEYSKQILKIGEKVEFVVQDKPDGFGYAVHLAKDAIGNEPFLLVLGDHVYSSKSADGKSCSRQMLDAYKQHQRSVIGLKSTAIENVSRFGTCTGVFKRDNPDDDGTGTDNTHHRVLDIKVIAEKPAVQYAKEHLTVPGMPSDQALTMFGQYIVSPKVFGYLGENIAQNVRHGGMIGFTPALERLKEEEGLLGLVVDGQRFDIGTPALYFQTCQAFAASRRPATPALAE